MMKIHQARYFLYMMGINAIVIVVLYFLLTGIVFIVVSLGSLLAILGPWIYVYYLAYCTKPPENSYEDIDPKTAKKKISSQDGKNRVKILDVRSKREYQARHLPNSTHIGYNQVGQEWEKIGASKDEEILVFCAIGHRSKIASIKLAELGFKKVKNVVGGIESFRDRGYPLED